MSKVEELSEKLCDWAKEQQPHEPEFLFVDCLIDLLRAVRDEEEKEANETLFPASWCHKTQCDSCPAKGTRYCG